MIIGICGYGYTGSGAILDLLKEYEECCVLDSFEFVFTYVPYGLNNLKFHLVDNVSRYFSDDAVKCFLRWIYDSNSAIRNIGIKRIGKKLVPLSEEYIHSLVDAEWNGISVNEHMHYNYFDKKIRYRINIRLLKLYRKLFGKVPKIFPNSKMYIAVPDLNKFLDLSRKYIFNLIKCTGADISKKIILNQPFEANRPEQSFMYFEDPKAIVVDRDPRDLYLLAKKVLFTDARFIPTDSVEDFIKFYKATHKNLSAREDILRINFESLIYDYDNTVSLVESFLGLSENKNKQKYFNPDVSKNNTMLYNRFTKHTEDIKRIEEELVDYLYPFPESSYISKGRLF